MFCGYQEREELEDELYGEGEESEGSEVNSELEFQLYSQLHYYSNAGEGDEEEEEEEERNAERQQPSRSHDTDDDSLREPVEGHTEQSQKAKCNKKQKVEVKGRRVFQEVIVVDSGTEVITLSDSDGDDRVCHFTGQKLPSQPRPVQTSTPAQQKRRRSPSLDSVVLLDSEGSGSGSGSDSGSDSDSDGLENWMLLGRREREEDSSIQLNLEGRTHSSAESDGDADAVWDVSDRDRDAQIFNRSKGQAPFRVQRVTMRYYTDKNVTCRSCNKNGHLSKNCPTPRKVPCCVLCAEPGHMQRDCPSRHCGNCGLPGHLYEACADRSYWHKQCHRCGMTGHFHDACPEIWRQYHLTITPGLPRKLSEEDQGRSPAYCSNCSRKGHFSHECSQRRMYNGTYPSTTYINYYDTREDMKSRDHRLKFKIKELKEAGLFPSSSQTPLTPHGPPKKKQKTNYSHNHTPKSVGSPYQNHKPVRSPNINHTPQPFPTLAHRKPGQAKKWTPKTKMADKQKGKQQQQQRAVPKVKMAAANTPKASAGVIIDESHDFPRGGGDQKKKKRKKKKGLAPGGQPSFSDPAPPLFGTGGAGEARRKRTRARGRDRKAAKMAADKMYPTDENLFIIKQRKRKR